MRCKRTCGSLVAMLVFAAASMTMSGARAASSCGTGNAGGDWRNYGQDLDNSRNQPAESTIGASNVGNLQFAWKVKAPGGTYSNTPIIADGCLFTAAGGGALASYNADSGELNWKRTFSGNGSSLVGSVITGSPAVGGGRVFAAIGNSTSTVNGGWSYEVAVWQDTGLPAWPNETGWGSATGNSGTTLDTTPAAYVVASPVYYSPDVTKYPDGLVFQGFMGGENASTPRGGWVIINATNGSIVKKGYTISDADYAAGHRGASIWSTAAIDTATNYVYVGTGNPASKDEDVNANAIVKIDGDPSRSTFGTMVGSYHGLPDNYTTATNLYDQAVCQSTGSVRVIWGQTCGQQDLDFGAAPNLFTVDGVRMVGDLQKAGVYHAIKADDMSVAWTQIVGTPGFPQNSNSSAVVDGNVFVAAQMPGQLWKLALSNGQTARPQWVAPIPDGLHFNPTSTANGLVYTGDSSATLRVFDSATGVPLFARNANQDAGATVAGDVGASPGVAIARNKVYWAVAGFILVYKL